MTNFSSKLEEQSESELKNNINIHQPNFASLSSDELTRRSLDNLRKTMVDLDSSNKKYSLVILLFAIVQIIIAGLQLVLDIKGFSDKFFAVFIALIFIGIIYWLIKQIDKN